MKFILFILILLPGITWTQSGIKNYPINFKGFAVNIADDAQDENGNHILVGEIEALESDPDLLDTMIHRVFHLRQYVTDDAMGIIILTDSNYKILKVRRSFNGKQVIYDNTHKRFIIGANNFTFIEKGDDYVNLWHPVIITTNLEFEMEFYLLQDDYMCILQHFEMKDDHLTLFTRSTNNEILKERRERVEVITVSLNNYEESKNWKGARDFKRLRSLETAVEPGRVSMTSVSEVDSAFFFVTSTLDQYDLTNRIHLYTLHGDSLKETPYFADFLKRSLGYADWVHINEFTVDQNKNTHILYHKATSKEEMAYVRLDSNDRFLLQKKIPLEYYADFNKMIVLSNGNSVIIDITEEETWRYSVYDSEMDLIKVISTDISRKYYPNLIREIEGEKLECIFYVNKTSIKDCLVQIVDL